MAVQVIVPRIGWSMEKGVFSQWLKSEGEFVDQGDAVFTIEADKAVEEVLSEDAGILSILPGVAFAGAELLVGTVIGYLLGATEAPPQHTPTEAKHEGPPERIAQPTAPILVPKTFPEIEKQVRELAASPRARRVSRELAIDWRRLNPTGTGGRVRERDVVKAAQARPTHSQLGLEKLSSLRVRADATELVALLDRLASSTYVSQQSDHYEGILLKLAVKAHLKSNLVMNPSCFALSRITDEGLVFLSLQGIENRSIGEVAALSREPAGIREELSGAEAFTTLSLNAHGLDEYLPNRPVPGGQLLLFGRLLRGSTRGEGASIALALSFSEEEVGLIRASKFLEDVRIAIEDPFVFLA